MKCLTKRRRENPPSERRPRGAACSPSDGGPSRALVPRTQGRVLCSAPAPAGGGAPPRTKGAAPRAPHRPTPPPAPRRPARLRTRTRAAGPVSPTRGHARSVPGAPRPPGPRARRRPHPPGPGDLDASAPRGRRGDCTTARPREEAASAPPRPGDRRGQGGPSGGTDSPSRPRLAGGCGRAGGAHGPRSPAGDPARPRAPAGSPGGPRTRGSGSAPREGPSRPRPRGARRPLRRGPRPRVPGLLRALAGTPAPGARPAPTPGPAQPPPH